MAKFRGLSHQIARTLLLALCISWFAAITPTPLAPSPAFAKSAHVSGGPGDIGGSLESKPDQWGAPDNHIIPHTRNLQSPAPQEAQLPRVWTLLARIILKWI